ncbi:MAG: response regulator [Pseudomonadota bacterium]
MLKAVIVDANAMSRDLLNAVLSEGGYSVVGQTHTSAQGVALMQKFHPQLVFVALDQVEDGHDIVEQIRATMPKTMIFMVSATIDAGLLQMAQARGVHGFIVKPFKADAVLKTIKGTILDVIRKQQG